MFFVSYSMRAQDDNSAWNPIHDKEEIRVFSRSNTFSKIKEVKVISIINASLSTLVSLIKDAENQPSWAYKLSYVEQINEYDDFHWCTYVIADTPWPLFDRDNVTDVYLTQNIDSTIIISSKSIEDIVDIDDDYVRIPFVRASWTFIPLGKGKVKASFQLLVDVGGYVPDWVVNLFIDKGPFQTMLHMRNEAEKKKYKNIHLNYIME